MIEEKKKLSICAVIAVRNETPYLALLFQYLAQQEIDVAVIDNESTDGSQELYSAFKGKPIIAIESLSYRGCSCLSERLEAKQALYKKLNYDWFIHHDADEILEHRKPHYTLRDAIEQADQNEYNAINFEEYVFLPEPDEDDINKNYYIDNLRYYFFEPRKNRLNRAWKNSCLLNNIMSGGHRLKGKGLRIDPTNHIMRHYIILSQQHAFDKYLQCSYDKNAVKRGWHKQRLNFTRDNLALPQTGKYLFKLNAYDSKEFQRNVPAVKHYWQW